MLTPSMLESVEEWPNASVIRKVVNVAWSAFTLFLIDLTLPESSPAAPTKLLSYQGRVTDNNGQPIADGAYTIRFKLYTASADCTSDLATQVWTETHDGGAGNPVQVTATNGLFSVVLGTDADVVPQLSSLSFDADYWLQVKVGANPVFSPCDRLTTAPYAIRAIDANSAATASNANACSVDGVCETQTVDASATGSTFLGRIGVEGNTGISCAGVATGTSGIWYADAADCGTVFVGLNSATNGSEVWGIWIGNWDWTIDASGNVSQGGDLTVSGTDLDLIRGDTSYIHSVGRISFDWTAGTYDGPDNHGITSKAESNNNVAGALADDLSINSYSNVIVTIDSNQNSVSTFKIQNEAMAAGGGTDRLTLDESGNLTISGSIDSTTANGINADQCSADATCETNAVSATGNVYPSANNTYTSGTSALRWSTVYGVTGDLSGNLTVTGGTTTLNNAASNLINFGSVGVAVPSAASAGWKIKTYGNNYGLGIEGSTQWFSTGRYYKFYNSDGSTFWKNRIMFDTDNTLTYPAIYSYDTAGAATLTEFKTGMYNNGGTFYSQNQIYARAGIANDSADLTLNDTVDVTGGAIEVDGNTVIDDAAGWHRTYGATGWYSQTYGGGWYMSDTTWIRSYGSKQVYIDNRIRADGGYYFYADSAERPIQQVISYSNGGYTACPTGYEVVACFSDTDTTGQSPVIWGDEGGTEGNMFPPNECKATAGRMVCIWGG